MLVLLLTASGSVLASDDELAWGDYKGTCASTTLSFRMDERGISSIIVNGTNYGKAELGEYGRFGSTALYEFSVKGRSSTKTVQFLVLFDEQDAPRGVTGFYFETVIQRKGSGKEPKLLAPCTLTMEFSSSNK